MTYRVTKTFFDRQDNYFRYLAGDTYPRPGLIPTEKRIKELASGRNRLHVQLIEEVEEEQPETKKPARRKSKK